MADAIKLAAAQKVYATVCAALDERGWKYDRDDEKLVVRTGVRTEDLPVHHIIIVDAERQILRMASPIPLEMAEDKRAEGAVITTVATMGLRDGNFDYDLQTGRIVFRLTASFRGSEIGIGLAHYFIECTNSVVSHYNDRFEAVNSGKMSVADFIELERE